MSGPGLADKSDSAHDHINIMEDSHPILITRCICKVP